MFNIARLAARWPVDLQPSALGPLLTLSDALVSLDGGLQQQRAGFATHGVSEGPPGGGGVPRFYNQVSIQLVDADQVDRPW